MEKHALFLVWVDNIYMTMELVLDNVPALLLREWNLLPGIALMLAVQVNTYIETDPAFQLVRKALPGNMRVPIISVQILAVLDNICMRMVLV